LALILVKEGERLFDIRKKRDDFSIVPHSGE
jgi:hypothetical protein